LYYTAAFYSSDQDARRLLKKPVDRGILCFSSPQRSATLKSPFKKRMLPKIKIILGSTRNNRFGDKPANWLLAEARKRGDFEVELLDLKEYDLPFFTDATPPSIRTAAYDDPNAQRWVEKIAEADGFIIVSPEYNHGYPAALKNAIDYPYKQWNNKPVALVSYGSAGGARVIEQLRLVAAELQMVSIRQTIMIPWSVMAPIIAGQTQWQSESLDPFLQSAPEKLFDQLLWWTHALKVAREQPAS
jgi:NAD(P)H-dependent FMN reductase